MTKNIPVGHNRRLAVTYLTIDALKARDGHARVHSRKQVRQIAASIQQFGFATPIGIDEDNVILSGHGRWEAAKLLGMNEVATVCLAGMSDAEKRAYVLAENRIAENAGWDRELLAIELNYLLTIDTDFSIEVTGFEMPEIDAILIGEPEADTPDAEFAPEPGVPVVSRAGDLWHIGDHRLLCGDARDPSAYKRLLGGELAGLVLTDPPYNVPIVGNVSGLGTAVHREFAMASGEMTTSEFTSFLATVMQALANASTDGSLHMVFMDWRHIREIMAAGDTAYTEFKNLVVWNKTNAGMGTFYRSQHELLFVFKKGTAKHVNNFGLGEHGRHRTNVWTYAGANSFRAGRDEELAMHPTCKPVQMLVDAMLDCSNRGSIVLDAFAGSGSMFVAAHRAGRRGRGIEIDPAYVDVAVRRLQQETGLVATLEGGDAFGAVAGARGADKREAA